MPKRPKTVPASSVPIHGLEWIFYVWGWITGALNAIFWVYQVVLYLAKNNGQYFFGDPFHRRVFYWGIFTAVVFGFVLLILLLVFGVGMSMVASIRG